MSDDFTWRPATSRAGTSSGLRMRVVLVSAAIGLILGAVYPIKMVVTAIERVNLPPKTGKGGMVASAAQDSRADFMPRAEDSGQEPPQLKNRTSGIADVVSRDPGTAEPPKVVPEARIPSAPSVAATQRQRPPRERTTAGLRARGDRNVLVVVRRRGPPYDTKILRGRVHYGQLIVDAHGLTLR